jgi:hypothetical protein
MGLNPDAASVVRENHGMYSLEFTGPVSTERKNSYVFIVPGTFGFCRDLVAALVVATPHYTNKRFDD